LVYENENFTQSNRMNIRLILSGLAASAALCAMPGIIRGAQIFVVNFGTGTIGEYTTSGATVDPVLISGLSLPEGIAVSGGNLFVTSSNLTSDTGRNGEYTTSGATVNPALITTLGGPSGIAVSGKDLQNSHRESPSLHLATATALTAKGAGQ
jgi:hypothetical protein